jgi:DNA-directed RNA polymerase subunit RPC12/RpoP
MNIKHRGGCIRCSKGLNIAGSTADEKVAYVCSNCNIYYDEDLEPLYIITKDGSVKKL